MNKKTANEQEVKKFSDMASEWWDPNGKFSPLHKFNPVRQEYLIDRIASHFLLNLDKKFSFSMKELEVFFQNIFPLEKNLKHHGVILYPLQHI